MLIVAVLVILLVIAYLAITSSGVLKALLLPRLSEALDARFDAERIVLRRCSSIEIRKLTVVSHGGNPLAIVGCVRVRFSPFSLLRGRLRLDEVLMDAPSVSVVVNDDHSINLDFILKPRAGDRATSPPAPRGAVLEIKLLRVENAAVTFRKGSGDAPEIMAGISHLVVTAQNVRKGEQCRVEFRSNLNVQERLDREDGVALASMDGLSHGSLDLELDDRLLPARAAGQFVIQCRLASGRLADIQGKTAILSVDLVPGELRQLTLEFLQESDALGAIKVSGPCNFQTQEARLQLDVAKLDRRLLNLIPLGLEFGATRLESSNLMVIAAGGRQVLLHGSITGAEVSLKRGAFSTLPIELKISYELSADWPGRSATLKAFQLCGSQGDREVLRGTLPEPQTINWGESSESQGSIAFGLVLGPASVGGFSPPLTARLLLDLSGSTRRILVRRGDLQFDSTSRAMNQAQLIGEIDFTRKGMARGVFKWVSESLDVTPWFDRYTAGFKNDPDSVARPDPASPGTASQDPASIRSPIENLQIDVQIGRLFLRETCAEGIQATLHYRDGRLEVRPTQFSVNGAPFRLSSTLDLVTPGLKCSLKISADTLPIRPLVNSFAPTVKDRIDGNACFHVDITCAGHPATHFRERLSGEASFALTHAKGCLVETGLHPSLVSVLAGLLASLLNLRELRDSPITDLVVAARMGDGTIKVTEGIIRSAALECRTAGGIPIADDWRQSPLDLPIEIRLRRDLVERAHLTDSLNRATANQPYVVIPLVASIKGVLGAPTAEIDKTKAAILLARGLGGRVSDQAGRIIGGVVGGATQILRGVLQGMSDLVRARKTGGPAAPSEASSPDESVKDPSGVFSNEPRGSKKD